MKLKMLKTFPWHRQVYVAGQVTEVADEKTAQLFLKGKLAMAAPRGAQETVVEGTKLVPKPKEPKPPKAPRRTAPPAAPAPVVAEPVGATQIPVAGEPVGVTTMPPDHGVTGALSGEAGTTNAAE